MIHMEVIRIKGKQEGIDWKWRCHPIPHNHPLCTSRICSRTHPFQHPHHSYLIDTLPIDLHNYADDIQLYTNCIQYPTTAPSYIINYIQQIGKLLSTNSLCFNPLKTEILFMHLPVHSTNIFLTPPGDDGTQKTYSTQVRNLGVVFYSTISFTNHISHLLNQFITNHIN